MRDFNEYLLLNQRIDGLTLSLKGTSGCFNVENARGYTLAVRLEQHPHAASTGSVIPLVNVPTGIMTFTNGSAVAVFSVSPATLGLVPGLTLQGSGVKHPALMTILDVDGLNVTFDKNATGTGVETTAAVFAVTWWTGRSSEQVTVVLEALAPRLELKEHSLPNNGVFSGSAADLAPVLELDRQTVSLLDLQQKGVSFTDAGFGYSSVRARVFTDGETEVSLPSLGRLVVWGMHNRERC